MAVLLQFSQDSGAVPNVQHLSGEETIEKRLSFGCVCPEPDKTHNPIFLL
ncbi:hypothetical protein [Bradyrhizobium sp. 195]|nr:hypothetical protein [Bradyrhizobium sp. 195]UPK30925.1 hypothetical protein IVB26_40495 [Bradyrhizobium sp. 195]